MKTKFFSDVKTNLQCMGTLFLSCLASRGAFIAAETAVGTGLENGGEKILNEVATVYCGSLGWLLMGINVIVLFISKNDKVIAAARRVLIGCIVIYIVLKILTAGSGGIIGSSTDTVVDWINS